MPQKLSKEKEKKINPSRLVSGFSPTGSKYNIYAYDKKALNSKIGFANLIDNGLIPLNASTFNYLDSSLKTYTKENIESFIKNITSENSQKELRKASRYMYVTVLQYQTLINYMANLHYLAYTIAPFKFSRDKLNEKAFTAGYDKTCNFLEIFNIKHIVRIMTKYCLVEDVFYGYKYQTKDSLTIKRLNPDFCRLSRKVDDCYKFSFDFEYFSSKKDELELFGDEFIRRYQDYLNKTATRWQELDINNQICLKFMENIPYPVVPFTGAMTSVFDIEDYKALAKSKTEMDNYKILGLEIPIDENGEYKLLDKDIEDYYASLCNVLPDNIGAFVSAMKVNEFSFEKTANKNSDKIAEAQRNFWNDVGISSLLFGGDTQNKDIMKNSINSDEGIMFSFMKQVERNINLFLKQLSGTQKFKITFVDASIYNKNDNFNQALKAAQYGLPTISQLFALLGYEPYDLQSMNFLEDEILKLKEKLIPLSSSFTQTGRPANTETGGDTNE